MWFSVASSPRMCASVNVGPIRVAPTVRLRLALRGAHGLQVCVAPQQREGVPQEGHVQVRVQHRVAQVQEHADGGPLDRRDAGRGRSLGDGLNVWKRR